MLLYNEVVYREVRQHIEEYVKAAVGEYNAAIKNRGFAPFRNTGKWEKQLAVLDEKALVNEQWQAWDVDHQMPSGGKRNLFLGREYTPGTVELGKSP